MMLRRITALFWTLCLVVGLIPSPAFAVETGAGNLTAASVGSAGTYYVATDGNDGNAGTIDAPFATIAHAASVMQAGDTCYIRGGIYRERLSDHNRKVGSQAMETPTIPKLMGTQEAPFTFQAYEGEKVALTGCEPITGWEKVDSPGSADIWRATMNWDMYLGKELGSGAALPSGQEDGIANGNLVFAQGSPCIEGRWPNVYADAPATATCGIPDSIMDLDRYAKTDAGTGLAGLGLRIVDDSLATAQAAGALPTGTDLTGAQVWCAGGEAYESLVYLINGHDMQTGTLTFDKVTWGNNSAPSYTNPRADNIYYVTSSLALVDQPGEWYKDVKNGQLYLCMGSGEDPNDMLIEAKQRTYAIDFGESSYVTFRGVNVYGGIVGFMGNANHCTFTQAEVQATDVCQGPTSYSSQWERANGYGSALGVDLGGTFNAVMRCDFHDMFGEAVRVTESDNYVVNNSVRRANIEHSGGIQLSGKRHMVSHNTVTLVGRLAIGGGYKACEVCYNDLSYAMRLSRDGGIIYCNAYDYGGSELHHNVLHDSKEGEGNRPAFYIDPLVENFTFHHNVIYGAEYDEFDNTWLPAFNTRAGYQKKTLTLSPFGLHLVIANNTFVNTLPISITQWDKDPVPDYGGSLLANNLFRSAIVENYTCDLQKLGWTFTNNLGGTEGPRADSTGQSGDFSFQFREGDFRDAEAHDYTLAAGSEAIDAGIAIPGITDGFAGSAPDVGAFESGQGAWSAGCDLSRDFPFEGPSTGAVPMTDVLDNGTFESYEALDSDGNRHPWEASTDKFQLTGWTQEGDLTHYHSSAWNYWGEIAGDGIYCVQMRSGGTLSQKVTGLKPNTLYAIAGYGRVASDYILGNEAAAGWGKNGNELASVRPQSGIGNARTLQFGDVDFGTVGADQLIVGLSGAALGPTSEGLIVRVRIDDRVSGPIVGEQLCDHWNAYGGRHEWLTVAFNEAVTGKHNVFLEFDTHLLEEEKAQGKNKNPDKIGDGSLYGLFFANSHAEDAVTISAKASGDSSAGTAELVCKESRYTRPQRHAYVCTGADGTIDVEVTKTGSADSALVGYVDTLSLYEVFPELDEVRLSDTRLLERVKAQLDAQGVAYLREGQGALSMAGNDIARVTSLDLSDSGIKSLEGIGLFTFLERIDVSGNHITDFSPLAGIEGLEIVGKSTQTSQEHAHEWGAWTIVKAPTCTSTGIERRTCALDAAHVEERVISALGHTWGEWTVVKAPTCTAAGIERRTCALDAAHVEERGIPALGHAWGEWGVVRPCTDTDDGLLERTCSLCGEAQQKALPAGTLYFPYDGADAVWIRGAANPLHFTFKRAYDDPSAFSHFAGIKVDGATVGESDYDARAGSVVITLHADYLDKLVPGNHEIQVLFDDGNNPSAAFAVQADHDEDPEPGGDPAGGSGDSPGGSGAGGDSSGGNSDAGGGDSAGAIGDPASQPESSSAPGAVSGDSASGATRQDAGVSGAPAATAQRAMLPPTGDAIDIAIPLALALGGIAVALVRIPTRRRK